MSGPRPTKPPRSQCPLPLLPDPQAFEDGAHGADDALALHAELVALVEVEVYVERGQRTSSPPTASSKSSTTVFFNRS